MSIRQFRALEAISEYGSFAAAAKALNLTQSAISMQVAALEESLGVPLFDRQHRPPRLTRAGTVVLRHARVILSQYNDIFDALSEARPYHGSFRLGVIPTILTNLLPLSLMRLREEEPGLTVNVSSGLSGELMREVETGELDAALMHKPTTLGTALSWRDIAQQRVVVVAPPESTGETPQEIFERHPYIRFNRSAWVAPLVETRLSELGISPDTRAEIQSIEAIHLLVGLGFGASILPDVSTESFARTSLRIVPFGEPPVYRTVGILSRTDMAKKNARRIIGDVFAATAGRPNTLKKDG
ncbi:DNA-binding transcriptional LysR family regulator [Rhodobium orientis]|uniref:HTH lysR-type domain-containing protein n=1 Tax=Rhodobium orientis TaxID=34017 RepID=A0A327JTJ7_9HYPH|nr:LysR family transcriptional regulator [Rhodobium orientis]MBB4302750.1 DNA-binding transcriptional LysR family regulator [Rhodobium orientis]MBK5948531.1 hypothetical protein [Rhodobium orientis]RAI29799.1 hypothetical protein CH339_01925 [Rhodobium orientis]